MCPIVDRNFIGIVVSGGYLENWEITREFPRKIKTVTSQIISVQLLQEMFFKHSSKQVFVHRNVVLIVLVCT